MKSIQRSTLLHEIAAVRLSVIEYLLLALFLGIFATFRTNYFYGLGNQIEQLPAVMKILNPNLFPNDVMLDYKLSFGHRYYFLYMFALLGKYAPLYLVSFLGTVFCNVLIIFITFLSARNLLNSPSDLAPILSCFLLTAFEGIEIGTATFILWREFVPAAIAMPLALLSLWAGMRRKPWISMLSACFASIPHALIGLETGAIAIATAGVIEVLDCWREKKSFKTIMVRIRPALMAGIAFLLFGYFFWIRRVMLCLDDDLFIHLLTFVRAPHHYTPSYFRRLDWLALIVFLISSYLSWSWWRKKDQPSKTKSDSFLIPIVLILILLFGGYVFVELIPIRIWVSAQIYRLVYIIKWLGLILIGRSIALWVSQLSSSPRSGLSSILALIGNGRAQPLVLFAAHVWQWIKEQTAFKRFPVLTAVIGVILVLTSLASLVFYGNLLEFAFMMLFLVTLLIIVKVRRTGWRRIVMLSIIGLLTFTVLQLRTTHPAWMNLARITIEDGDDPIDKVARFAKEHTPVDALFLCPPRCGRFRITAERGIVIDFISFVIADEAMQSWYNRILDCYGEAEAPGFEGARELDQQYHQISESKIHYLAANYGASHAVLYKDTPCAFPVLYEDEIYKLVRIE